MTRHQQKIIDDATRAVSRAVLDQYKEMRKAVGEEIAPRFILTVLMLNAVQAARCDRRLADATGALDGAKFAAVIHEIMSEALHQMALN